MKYEEKKAKEILKALVKCDLIQGGYMDSDVKVVELKVKEIIRDVRHKCVENINEAAQVYQHKPAGMRDAEQAVMNTSMDECHENTI